MAQNKPPSKIPPRIPGGPSLPGSPETGGAAQSLKLEVQLDGAEADDALSELRAYAFDRNGQAFAEAGLKLSRQGGALVGGTELRGTAAQWAQARVAVAPVDPRLGLDPAGGEYRMDPPQPLPWRVADLQKRLGAWLEPLRFNPRDPRLLLRIPKPGWARWPKLCLCWVRGRLVKRVQLPSGGTLDLPICHARVTLCEVDPWPWILQRLPLPDLQRLRSELLELIRHPRPLPFPEPEPEPWFSPLATAELRPALRPALPTPLPLPTRSLALRSLQRDDAPLQALLQLRTGDIRQLRDGLAAQAALWRPYLCWLDWLEPWVRLARQCFSPVQTDEQGRFSRLIVHDCSRGDVPDIYVSAEQLQGGSWVPIHQPPVRCHTHWNYRCGDEITVLVTDPRAQPCIPDLPTEPPAGVQRWVMPMAIGGSFIQGTAGGAAQNGWVRPDGLTNYGGLIDAPFGSTLGFRQQHSLDIPASGAGQPYHYQWSWRRAGSSSWNAMRSPVSRSYVRDRPGLPPQFPAVQLGPQPVNELFRFKPAVFSPSDWGLDTSADPAGTAYYWPTDNSIGDLYAARWTTPGTADAASAPAEAGAYQVKLEVFDLAGNPVAPGAASFRFIVPQQFDGSTLETREATAAEMDGNGFVFTVWVDNSRCTAAIQAPVLGSGASVDDCGFLRYAPGSLLTLAFDPLHPAQRATFSFAVIRGAEGVGLAAAGGEVGLADPPYARSPGGRFSHSFAVGDLMQHDDGSRCTNAAFSAQLTVLSKATDGSGRIPSVYDTGAWIAFALAVEEVPPPA